jgi:hypothetical protein
MLTCPACKRATISKWRKLTIGSGTSTTCPACGTRVTVPAYDAAVGFGAVLLPSLLHVPLPYIGVLFVGYVAWHQLQVPLIIKGTKGG